MRERVAEDLNNALHAVFDTDPTVHLLGEDVLDPYGGAFKITKGLSRRHPDRVWAMPLSEGSFVGVASGLALAGQKAIVEIMFGDFVALAFDQILNFASKSVSMYGRPVRMPVVVRCPTGGNRGYGPTHSQSLQKHFIGVPGLSLYEVSPFRPSLALLREALRLGNPAMVFEDKILYTKRVFREGSVDDVFGYDHLDEGATVARVYADDPADCDVLLIAPGGLTERALGAARSLLFEEDLACQLVVPSRLYPFDLEPLLPVLRLAGLVCVVEESTCGGTWGAEVAHRIHTELWGELRRPVHLIHSRDGVIPTASHLEREVLVQAATIHRAVKGLLASA